MQCKECGSEVLFITSARTKRPIAVETKKIVFTEESEKVTIVTENGVVITSPHAGLEGHEPHVTKCGQGEKFRKGGTR